MTAVATGSKSEVAYDWIRARIANHEYGPGYRLVLGTIATELDMSVVLPLLRREAGLADPLPGGAA